MDAERKIKILWTSEHCCIRVIKQVVALRATGRYWIHGLAKQVSYGSDEFDVFSFYHHRRQFEETVRSTDYDIYIHSNEPNHQLNRIRREKPDKPIILDAHDLDSIRQGVIPLDEMRAMTNCNGVVFVSPQVRDVIVNDIHRDQLKGKEYIVLEHYCNEKWLALKQPANTNRSGLVYHGGMQSPPYKTPHFRYRHLYPVMKRLVELGHELHLMPGNPDAYRTYANIGAFVYEPQMYQDLMPQLCTKKWGMVIFNNPSKDQMQVNLTLTNKHYEYIMCGMPFIVYGAPATAEWVKQYGCGLNFERLDDITPQILDENCDRLKAEVDAIRPKMTMEKHIHRLEKLINKLLNTDD